MSSVADIDGYFAEPEIIQICISKQPFRVKPFKTFGLLGIKDPMSRISLHVVGGLIEVSHSRDMILSRLSHDLARMRDHDGGVPNYVPLISFQDGRNYNHVIGLGVLKITKVTLITLLLPLLFLQLVKKCLAFFKTVWLTYLRDSAVYNDEVAHLSSGIRTCKHS